MIHKPLNVELFERARFWVSSETESNRRYLVDFSHDEPMCDCDDYRFRKHKCKHIKCAREWMADQVVVAWKNQEKTK